MFKKLAVTVVIAGVLITTGCASRSDVSSEGSNSSGNESYYQNRSDEAKTKFITKDLPDGSTVICAITFGYDLADQDCVVVPAGRIQE